MTSDLPSTTLSASLPASNATFLCLLMQLDILSNAFVRMFIIMGRHSARQIRFPLSMTQRFAPNNSRHKGAKAIVSSCTSTDVVPKASINIDGCTEQLRRTWSTVCEKFHLDRRLLTQLDHSCRPVWWSASLLEAKACRASFGWLRYALQYDLMASFSDRVMPGGRCSSFSGNRPRVIWVRSCHSGYFQGAPLSSSWMSISIEGYVGVGIGLKANLQIESPPHFRNGTEIKQKFPVTPTYTYLNKVLALSRTECDFKGPFR